MKAAVVWEVGKSPVYSEFQEPIPHEGEVCVHVAASALTNFTKIRAAGKHFSFSARPPFVVGIDGVGKLEEWQTGLFSLSTSPVRRNSGTNRRGFFALHDQRTVLVRKGEILQIFSNVITNAIDAMRQGGKLKVSTREMARSTGDGIETIIRDEH